MAVNGTTQVGHLVDRAMLKVAAAHGSGLDLRGMSFTHVRCEDRALIRAQAEGITAFELAPGRWVASSGCRPGHGYTVEVYQGGRTVRCGCDAGRRGLVCKHQQLVARLVAQKQVAA
jgi:hypothetical protein